MFNEWQHQAVTLARGKALSWREIASKVGKPKSTVSDFLRKYTEMAEGTIDARDIVSCGLTATSLHTQGLRFIPTEYIPDPDDKEHINQRILFISDLHIPYHHPKVFYFLEGLKARYQPTRVILLGDELDKHALSFHDSDPDLPSAGDELRKALPYIKQLKALFPIADILESNHGSLLYRKGKHHGIPRHYLKSYNEILEVDDDWKWHFDMVLDLPDGQKVYVHHGKNVNAIKVAQMMGMSHVSGHFHESFGVQYYSTPTKLLWGMNAGCLIDRKSLAFAYNNNNLKRPIIGTGLIIDGVPILEAMPL